MEIAYKNYPKDPINLWFHFFPLNPISLKQKGLNRLTIREYFFVTTIHNQVIVFNLTVLVGVQE